MNENQTPWAAAAKAMSPKRNEGGWSLADYATKTELIKQACERHASDLRAENERLKARIEQLEALLVHYEFVLVDLAGTCTCERFVEVLPDEAARAPGEHIKRCVHARAVKAFSGSTTK